MSRNSKNEGGSVWFWGSFVLLTVLVPEIGQAQVQPDDDSPRRTGTVNRPLLSGSQSDSPIKNLSLEEILKLDPSERTGKTFIPTGYVSLRSHFRWNGISYDPNLGVFYSTSDDPLPLPEMDQKYLFIASSEVMKALQSSLLPQLQSKLFDGTMALIDTRSKEILSQPTAATRELRFQRVADESVQDAAKDILSKVAIPSIVELRGLPDGKWQVIRCEVLLDVNSTQIKNKKYSEAFKTLVVDAERSSVKWRKEDRWSNRLGVERVARMGSEKSRRKKQQTAAQYANIMAQQFRVAAENEARIQQSINRMMTQKSFKDFGR